MPYRECMSKPPVPVVPPHVRAMRNHAARMSAFATTAVSAYESAIAEGEALGIPHPVLEDLRAALINGVSAAWAISTGALSARSR